MSRALRCLAGHLTLAAILAMSLSASLGCRSSEPAAAAASADARPPSSTARTMAPDTALTDATGARVNLADLHGRVVLLNFWATWCAGCKLEMPWFEEFQTRYRDSGLSTIGVAMDADGWPTVTPFLATRPVGYRIVVGGADAASAYGLTSLPVSLLIDRTGRIASRHEGVVDRGEWEARIQALLHESAP